MDTERLQSLIDAYMSATATAEQEQELGHLVREADLAHMPAPLASDVRMIRTMLCMAETAVPQPDDFKAKLLKQLDTLAEEETGVATAAINRFRGRRIWLRSGIAAILSAAAVGLVLLITARTAIDMPTPYNSSPRTEQRRAAIASNLSKPAPARQETPAIATESAKPITATKSAEKAKPAFRTGNKAKPAPPQDPVEKVVDGVLVITEYYNPDLAYTPETEPVNTNAPVVMINEYGEVLTYNSIDQSPDAQAMLEEAFKVFRMSGKEMTRRFDDSHRMIQQAMNELENDR